MLQNLRNFGKISKFQLDNLVDLEKCWKMRIFLQRSVPILPKTSENFPKICQKAVVVDALSIAFLYSIDDVGGDLGGIDESRQSDTYDRRGWFGKFAKFYKIFANFWRARSRLYQNEILQENMRLTAFFKLYKICILLHRCNLKILAKKSVWKIR